MLQFQHRGQLLHEMSVFCVRTELHYSMHKCEVLVQGCSQFLNSRPCHEDELKLVCIARLPRIQRRVLGHHFSGLPTGHLTVFCLGSMAEKSSDVCTPVYAPITYVQPENNYKIQVCLPLEWQKLWYVLKMLTMGWHLYGITAIVTGFTCKQGVLYFIYASTQSKAFSAAMMFLQQSHGNKVANHVSDHRKHDSAISDTVILCSSCLLGQSCITCKRKYYGTSQALRLQSPLQLLLVLL